MAKILKNITISHEITPIGVAEPIIPTQVREDEGLIDSEASWQSGYSQGLTDGCAQERALLSEQINTVTQWLLSIPQAIKDHRTQLNSEIADIVLLIVSKFFVNQQQSKEASVHQITQVILQLNEKQQLKIALHPSDLALIQQGDIEIDLQDHERIEFIADERLRLGGCIITSEHGVFDAGIERQIEQLKQVLLKMKSQHE